jgi:PAS domain-containing protein
MDVYQSTEAIMLIKIHPLDRIRTYAVVTIFCSMNDKRETNTQHLADIEVIYATAPVGLCVLDAELRYVRINESLAQINGLPISEHIGRTIKEVVPELSPQLEKAFEEIRRTKSI